MISFLTPELEEFKTKIRGFCEEKLEKNASKWDEMETFPLDSLKAMADYGILKYGIPELYGGIGESRLKLDIIIEEVARVDPNTAFILEVESLFNQTLLLYGSESQKQILKEIVTGKKIGTFAMTEPTGGTDVSGINSTATYDPNTNLYLLNGSKYFITNASVADYFIIFAKTKPELKGKGISAFLVEKSFKNFRVGDPIKMTGFRGSAIAGLYYKNTPVPKENLIGNENEGIKIALSTFDRGRVNLSALGLGMLQRAFEESLSFSKTRNSGGNAIISNQFIQKYIADMATDLESARLMVYNTAMLIDQNKDFSKEAAMTKLFVSEAAIRHISNAVEIWGGYGYTRGTVIERLARDVHNLTLSLGTSEAMRMVISRHVSK
ncbi:MAG: acyl-CoA dehydrogenase family protein [Thermoplasmata archaeon]